MIKRNPEYLDRLENLDRVERNVCYLVVGMHENKLRSIFKDNGVNL